jgi:hypothetical protein
MGSVRARVIDLLDNWPGHVESRFEAFVYDDRVEYKLLLYPYDAALAELVRDTVAPDSLEVTGADRPLGPPDFLG